MKAKILGAGSIGNHLTQACRRMGWEVTLCDTDSEALRRTKESIYPARYGQWDDAIKLCAIAEAPRGGFDLIFLGTPPDIRLRLALEALEEKPRLLQLEKPVCSPSLEDAEALWQKSKKSRTVIGVGFDHLLGENTLRAESLLKENLIGKCQTLDVEFREYWGGIFSAHPWLSGPAQTYLGYWHRGGGASGEHSHATNLWQHFAHCLGEGKITEVTAAMDIVRDGKAEYDRICTMTVRTETGFLGRIVQDVVTRPPRKWAKIQGDKGYLEWRSGWKPGEDEVLFQGEGEKRQEFQIPKKRPDDFYQEMIHFEKILKGEIQPEQSPVSLERGLDTALVIAAAHRSHREKRTVKIDYRQGYRQEAIS